MTRRRPGRRPPELRRRRVAVAIAMMSAAGLLVILMLASQGVGGSSVWAADGEEGGSTVPIPPPSPPAPKPSTATPSQPTAEPTPPPPTAGTTPEPSPAATSRPTQQSTAESTRRPTAGPPTAPAPAVVTPTPSASQEPGLFRLDLSALRLSPEAQPKTRDGADIPLTPSGIRLESLPSGEQRVTLPLRLRPGQEASPFHDPNTGISWSPALSGFEGGLLTIPLSAASAPGNLFLRLGPLQGDGQAARATVISAEVTVGPVTMDSPGSVRGSAGFSATLQRVPPTIEIQVRGIAIGPRMRATAAGAAEASGAAIAALAFATTVETNLSDALISVTVAMSVNPAWVDRWGEELVRIVRVAGDGATELLMARPDGLDPSGKAAFRAESRLGLSTFALVAIIDPALTGPSGGGGAALWIGIAVGAAIAVAAAAGVLRLRRARRTSGDAGP